MVMDKRKFFLFSVVSFLLLLIPVFIFISFFFPLNRKDQKKPPVIPVPSDFKKDYSKINLLEPGKSTHEDVLRLLGTPVSQGEYKNKTVLYYPTPNLSFKNTVVVEKNIVSFAVEHAYRGLRGNYSTYTTKYGHPELNLYPEIEGGYDWFIFLKNGVGIESSNNEVTRIVYFIPQDKTSFINNIAGFLSLSQTPPEPQGEILY